MTFMALLPPRHLLLRQWRDDVSRGCRLAWAGMLLNGFMAPKAACASASIRSS